MYANSDSVQDRKYKSTVSLGFEEIGMDEIVIMPCDFTSFSHAKEVSAKAVDAILFSCVMLLSLARDIPKVHNLGTEASKGR